MPSDTISQSKTPMTSVPSNIWLPGRASPQHSSMWSPSSGQLSSEPLPGRIDDRVGARRGGEVDVGLRSSSCAARARAGRGGLQVEVVELGGPPVDPAHRGEGLDGVAVPLAAGGRVHVEHEALLRVGRGIAGHQSVRRSITKNGPPSTDGSGSAQRVRGTGTSECSPSWRITVYCWAMRSISGNRWCLVGLAAQHQLRASVGVPSASTQRGVEQERLVGEPARLRHDEVGDLDVGGVGQLSASHFSSTILTCAGSR